MPVLTDLAAAAVQAGVTQLYGKVLSRPALLVSDGINVIYACDVDVAATDPSGRISQFYQQNRDGTARTDWGGFTIPGDLTGLPGQEGWQLNDTLTINTVLHNVVIARNNAALIYADVGTPVTLTRSPNGQWQITGFSQIQPGTYTLTPVNLDDMTIGPVVDLSISSRLLTFGELGTLAPFGTLPFGASGIFVGNVLRRVV